VARVYLIASQHFDLIWRRPIEEYRSIRRQVLLRFLDLLDEFPLLRVTLVQARALREFLEDCPDQKPRLLQFIRDRHLEVALGGETLIDLNLVCGESIIRNLLYGKQWLERELATVPRTANFADAFGINGQMPQIIAGFGLDSLTGARMPGTAGKFQQGNYGAAMWTGFDGTSVMVFQDAMGELAVEDVGLLYGWGVLEGFDEQYEQFNAGKLQVDTEMHLGNILTVLSGLAGNLIPLNITGETHLPDRRVLSAVLEKADAHELKFATQSEYVEAVSREGLPVMEGEFNPVFTGCYTTRTFLKQMNRRVERQLLAAEMVESVNLIHGGKKQPCSNRPRWEHLALMQFHDALAGCHDDQSFEFVSSGFDNLDHVSRASMDRAMSDLCTMIDTRGPCEEALIVFNPTPHRKRECIWLAGLTDRMLLDRDNTPLPVQEWDGGTLAELPLRPGGVSVFWLRDSETANSCTKADPQHVAFCVDRFEVNADGTNLHVKIRGSDAALFTEVPSIVLREDTGSLWEENYTGRHDELVPSLVSYECGSVAHRVTYQGELIGGLWNGFEKLTFELALTFFSHLPKIAVQVRMDWSGRNTKLILHLPLAFPPDWEARHSVPFASVQRPDYAEPQPSVGEVSETVVFGGQPDSLAHGDWPVVHWVDVRGEGWGVALVNDGTPAHRVSQAGIDVGLVRSGTFWSIPIFPVEPTPLSFENGTRKFDFVLIPHDGNLGTGVLENELFQPPLVARTGSHPGCDSSELAVVETLPPNVSVSCLKLSEDGSRAVVLRLYEINGWPTEMDLDFPFPIKTVYDCNLEEKTKEKVDKLTFRPYEIRTLRLELP